MPRPSVIPVIGGARASEEERSWAESVGSGIAVAGHLLPCGGRGGVMEAACKGAAEAGGQAIGLLPGYERNQANPHVTIPIPTGLGEVRNLAVARGGQAVIAIGGSHGTLSEIAFALKSGRSVIGLGTWQGTDRGGEPLAIRRAKTAEQAVRWALEAAAGEGD